MLIQDFYNKINSHTFSVCKLIIAAEFTICKMSYVHLMPKHGVKWIHSNILLVQRRKLSESCCLFRGQHPNTSHRVTSSVSLLSFGTVGKDVSFDEFQPALKRNVKKVVQNLLSSGLMSKVTSSWFIKLQLHLFFYVSVFEKRPSAMRKGHSFRVLAMCR